MESRKVSFIQMKSGTPDDFDIISKNDHEYAKHLPSKIVAHLRTFANDDGAYQINRFEHCLQCATRALNDGADEEWIIAALLHDIGDILAPYAHAEASYAMLKSFVREEVGWVVLHHGIFQKFYNASLPDSERNKRQEYENHPCYKSAIKFAENWDQCSFDPSFHSRPIEDFIPLIEKIFKKRKYNY